MCVPLRSLWRKEFWTSDLNDSNSRGAELLIILPLQVGGTNTCVSPDQLN